MPYVGICAFVLDGAAVAPEGESNEGPEVHAVACAACTLAKVNTLVCLCALY